MNAKRITLKQVVLLTFLCLFITVIAGQAQGQVLPGMPLMPAEVNQKALRKQMKKAIEKQFATQKKGYQVQLAVRIEDIDRVCELDKKQKRILEVAAKGTILKTLANQKKQMKEMMAKMHFGGADLLEEGDAIEKDDESDKEDSDKKLESVEEMIKKFDKNNDKKIQLSEVPEEDIDYFKRADSDNDKVVTHDEIVDVLEEELTDEEDVAQLFEMGGPAALFGMGMGGQANPEDEKLWKATLKKVLTEEQQKKYKTALQARDAFMQKTAVSAFIAKAENQLLLSPEQRTKLTKYVDQKYGKKLLMRAKLSYQQSAMIHVMGNGFGVVLGGQMIGQDHSKKTKSPVEEILTEKQYELWKKKLHPELKGLQFLNQRGGGFGGGDFFAPGLE